MPTRRIDQEILKRHDQAVAAERSNEPGQARCRQEHHMAGAGYRQAERGHILQGLAVKAVEFFVAGADLKNRA